MADRHSSGQHPRGSQELTQGVAVRGTYEDGVHPGLHMCVKLIALEKC